MINVLEQIEKYILLITIFLFPVFVLPISPNPYVVPKLALLTFGVIIALILKCIRTVLEGKIEFKIGSFDLPIFLLILSSIVSMIFKTGNKMEALILPGTLSAIIFGAVLYFLVNQLRDSDKKLAKYSLFSSGVIFSLLTLMGAASTIFKDLPLPAYLKIDGFTPEGGFLPAIIFMGVLLIVGAEIILETKSIAKKALAGSAFVLIVIGVLASFYKILPGSTFSPKFPSFSNSWSVAADTIKESPLFGSGPGNYLTSFSRFRPISYNTTDLWSVKFATARSYYLTLMTENGLLGVAAMAAVIFVFYTIIKKEIRDGNPKLSTFALAILLISFLAFPATNLGLFLLFMLLAFVSHTKESNQTMSKLPLALMVLPFIAFSLVSLFFGYKFVSAEYEFQKGLNFLAQNNAAKTYDHIRNSTVMNPGVDRYHATFARVNLALASSLAQKKDISDQDKSTISTLIQQSINEGKATVTLNSLRSGNWELLARVYQTIMPFAKGADQYAIQTFSQAVALDPINPNLRLSLGGVYYALGRYDDAIEVFKLAVVAKPDLANSHYNLAIAYREKKDYDNAIAQMNIVLSLVKKDSNDYNLATKELDNLNKAKPVKTNTAGSENLTPPQTTVPSNVTPVIQLPEEANPPQPVTSPTPTP